MSNQTTSLGHFDFYKMDLQGNIADKPTRITTTKGVILNSHPACKPEQITRLAEIARETPNYPVDLSAWAGPEGDRYLLWNARIYWRTQ